MPSRQSIIMNISLFSYFFYYLVSVGYVTVGKGLTSHGELIGCLEDTPTADVVEVKHGKWDINKNCSVCGVYKFEGLDADVWADWDIDYCPHCGSKMDGGKK